MVWLSFLTLRKLMIPLGNMETFHIFLALHSHLCANVPLNPHSLTHSLTWKYGIMKDLHSASLRGRLPEFISSFLNDRHFRVRIGAILSDEYEQEMGVPQRCILSVTLFCLKINSIVKTLLPDTECSLYVDDFLIFFHSRHMPTTCFK